MKEFLVNAAIAVVAILVALVVVTVCIGFGLVQQ